MLQVLQAEVLQVAAVQVATAGATVSTFLVSTGLVSVAGLAGAAGAAVVTTVPQAPLLQELTVVPQLPLEQPRERRPPPACASTAIMPTTATTKAKQLNRLHSIPLQNKVRNQLWGRQTSPPRERPKVTCEAGYD